MDRRLNYHWGGPGIIRPVVAGLGTGAFLGAGLGRASKRKFGETGLYGSGSRIPPTPPKTPRRKISMPANDGTDEQDTSSSSKNMAAIKRKRKTSGSRSTKKRKGGLQKRMSRPRRKYVMVRKTKKFVRRPPKVSYKGLRTQCLKYGYVDQAEFSNIVSSSQCVTVGHNSFVYDSAHKTFWFALTKQLLQHLGILPVLQTQLLVGTQAGDVINFVFRNAQSSSIGPVPGDLTPAAITFTATGAFSWETLAVAIYANWKLNASTGGYMQREALYIEFIPANGSKLKIVRINLTNTKVTIHAKASLKIQNRSKAPGGTEENINGDNVGRVPLYGKQYYGYGSGTTVTDGQYQSNVSLKPFVGARDSGVIAISTTVDGMQEPLPAQCFPRVRRTGKMMAGPGVIKTSVLTDTVTKTVTDWINYFTTLPNDPAGSVFNQFLPHQNNVGKFRFYMLEKMLSIHAQNEPDIEVAYEHNYIIAGKVTSVGNQQIMRPLVLFANGSSGATATAG